MGNDVRWIESVQKSGKLSLDLTGVSSGVWVKAIKAAIHELNELFTSLAVNVQLEAGKEGLVPVKLTSGAYSLSAGGTEHNGTIPKTLRHGKTIPVQREVVAGELRIEKAHMFLPDRPREDPNDGKSRTLGEPVLRVIAAHECLHALGLIDHEPGLVGLLAQTFEIRTGKKPQDDRLAPFGSEGGFPPLSLTGSIVSRLQALW